MRECGGQPQTEEDNRALPVGSGCAAGCASCECCEWDVDPSSGLLSPGLMALSLSTAQRPEVSAEIQPLLALVGKQYALLLVKLPFL